MSVTHELYERLPALLAMAGLDYNLRLVPATNSALGGAPPTSPARPAIRQGLGQNSLSPGPLSLARSSEAGGQRLSPRRILSAHDELGAERGTAHTAPAPFWSPTTEPHRTGSVLAGQISLSSAAAARLKLGGQSAPPVTADGCETAQPPSPLSPSPQPPPSLTESLERPSSSELDAWSPGAAAAQRIDSLRSGVETQERTRLGRMAAPGMSTS